MTPATSCCLHIQDFIFKNLQVLLNRVSKLKHDHSAVDLARVSLCSWYTEINSPVARVVVHCIFMKNRLYLKNRATRHSAANFCINQCSKRQCNLDVRLQLAALYGLSLYLIFFIDPLDHRSYSIVMSRVKPQDISATNAMSGRVH